VPALSPPQAPCIVGAVTARRVLLGAAAVLAALAAGGPSALASSQRAIVAGGSHTCLLDAGGSVQCWGANDFGQLGDGTQTDRLSPVPVAGLPGHVEALAAGLAHTCALMDGGAVDCWGDNRYGQLGEGTIISRSTPTPVMGIAGAVAITAGSFHNCALMADGSVECWGDNTTAQLGDAYLEESRVPEPIDRLSAPARAIAAGNDHTCAILVTGAVECWGWNLFGQLGYGGGFPIWVDPIPVFGLTGPRAIDAGFAHTCALTATRSIECWGLNGDGQLGDGTTKDRPTPVTVSGIPGGISAIASGYFYNCALADGDVSCWGRNAANEVGDGTMLDRKTPERVRGLGRVDAISAGGYHTCALLSAGGFRCWGSNHYGQLGNGRKTNELEMRVRGQGTIRVFGVRCVRLCWAERAPGTRITLMAQAARKWKFGGWSGACAGRKRQCQLTLVKDLVAAARFVKRK
jgi:alpha-tubulin suppressor-like RCC1 family protein